VIKAGHISAQRQVPDSIDAPSYATTGVPTRGVEPDVKTPDLIERMRRTGAQAGQILATVGAMVAPGVTTAELDDACHQLCLDAGAYPSPLNYRGFPKSLCTSVNEVICHGIPDDRPIEDGDIVNLDVTIFREGVHGDTNRTFLAGDVDPVSQRLVDVTWRAMMAGIGAVAPGVAVNEIGRAIEDTVDETGFGVVTTFVGHGIGTEFHTNLVIPHYHDRRATTRLEEGMTFTVEPMISIGDPRERIWDDGWTAVTVDGSRVAQFEHTLVVTADGHEILTPWPDAD